MDKSTATKEDMSRYLAIGRSCACGNLRRASRVVTQVYDRFLQSSSLKVTQFILLMAVRMLGPITITRLAEKMFMDRTTCTRNLKGLQEKNFLHFEQPEDKRMKKIVLTHEGNEILEKTIPMWEKAQNFIANEVGKDRMTNLIKDLSKMVSLVRKA